MDDLHEPEAPLVAFDDAGLLVWRGRKLVRVAWNELTHIVASARVLWIGSRHDLLVLRSGAPQGPDFDPYSVGAAIRARWLAHDPGAWQRTEPIEALAVRPPAWRAVVGLAVVTIVAYVFEWLDLVLAGVGAFQPELVARGEWWRVVTANFLHALAPLHVITTLLALPLFGTMVERPLGTARTIVLMGASALAAMGASALAGYPSVVGGSGIVAGLAGALLALELGFAERLPAHWRLPRRLFIGALALQVLFELVLGFGGEWLSQRFGWFLPEIASAAHAGGFAAGFGLAWGMGARALENPGSPLPVRALAGAFVATAALGLACLVPFVVRDPHWVVPHVARLAETREVDPLTANNLAWILAVELEAEDLAPALALATRAVDETERRVPALLDTLAEVQFLSGDAESAVATIDEALAIVEGDEYLVEQRRRFLGERAAEDRPVDPGSLRLWELAEEPAR